MKAVLPVLRFLRERQARGKRCALVTLTGVTGSAARAPGEHMAVAEDGSAVGSFSGGCVEAAVIAEAQDVIAAGKSRLVRFGAGSRYIDIRLPCGGGIDLLFTPQPPPAVLDQALDLLRVREPLILSLHADGMIGTDRADASDRTGWGGDTFLVRHDPMLRLAILGHGAEPAALLRMADAYGAQAYLLSPQASLVDETRRAGMAADQLRVLGRDERLAIDPWTAVITLFHDHDWETALLAQALEGAPLFVGALGSRRTHAERCRRLLDTGVAAYDVERVHGPIGLIAASRDPQTLAISILAQVVQAYEQALAPTSADQASRPPRVSEAHHRVEPSSGGDRPSIALSSTGGNPAFSRHSRSLDGRKEEQCHVGLVRA